MAPHTSSPVARKAVAKFMKELANPAPLSKADIESAMSGANRGKGKPNFIGKGKRKRFLATEPLSFTAPVNSRRARAIALVSKSTSTVQDREGSYGAPEHDMARIAQMWTAILGVTVTPEQVPLCMIAVKLSRASNAYKDDNTIDIVGYAQVYEECIAYKQEQETNATALDAVAAIAHGGSGVNGGSGAH